MDAINGVAWIFLSETEIRYDRLNDITFFIHFDDLFISIGRRHCCCVLFFFCSFSLLWWLITLTRFTSLFFFFFIHFIYKDGDDIINEQRRRRRKHAHWQLNKHFNILKYKMKPIYWLRSLFSTDVCIFVLVVAVVVIIACKATSFFFHTPHIKYKILAFTQKNCLHLFYVNICGCSIIRI